MSGVCVLKFREIGLIQVQCTVYSAAQSPLGGSIPSVQDIQLHITCRPLV